MNFPAEFTALTADEMVYVEGGAFKDAFDYVMGNYMRDQVLSGVRSAVWNSAKQGSVAPMVSWYENLSDMSFLGTALYLYGAYLLFVAVKTQFEK